MSQILLIDDDDSVREILRQVLVELGHEVFEASNGKQAVKLCEETMAEVVITDIFMPDQEGLETIGALRHSHPHVKIIAISGGGRSSAQEYLRIATLMGADRVLQKPFSIEELRAALAGLLGTD